MKVYNLKISNTTIGILWMLAHCAALVLIMGVVRELTNSGLSNYIIIFWQNVFAFMLITPYCALYGGFHKTKKLHLHIGRSITGITSGLCLFYGLSQIQLNTATAITFTGPLFTTIFAILFLKEKTYPHRVIGLCIGFAGVLVVLRPGTDAFDLNALWLVLTAALWGCTDMFIKLMNRTESLNAMMFYRVLLMLIMTTPLAIYFWQDVNNSQLILLAALAVLDLTNFGTVTLAYRKADISVLMPFDFSRLVISSILAYFMFNETLSLWVFVGSLIIVYGTLFVVYQEKKRNRIMSNETI